jgi:rod shape-determining protein MreD
LLVLIVMTHTAVLPQLRVFGVAADILLLVAIAGGISGGPESGAILGFTAGILADCFLQTPFGLSALAYCLIGWGVGSFQTRILHATWWIPVVTAALASAVGVVLFVVVGLVVGQDQLWSWRVVPIVSVTSLWAAMLSPFVVRAVRWALMVDSQRPGLALR